MRRGVIVLRLLGRGAVSLRVADRKSVRARRAGEIAAAEARCGELRIKAENGEHGRKPARQLAFARRRPPKLCFVHALEHV